MSAGNARIISTRTFPNYEEQVFDYFAIDGNKTSRKFSGINFEAHYEKSTGVPTVYTESQYDPYPRVSVITL